MHSIRVEPKSQQGHNTIYEVSVGEVGDTTTYRVTVPKSYYLKLTDGKIDEPELVRRSFEFLLAREPKESILREFELSAIQRYFKEYEEVTSKA